MWKKSCLKQQDFYVEIILLASMLLFSASVFIALSISFSSSCWIHAKDRDFSEMRAVPTWIDKVHDRDKVEQWWALHCFSKHQLQNCVDAASNRCYVNNISTYDHIWELYVISACFYFCILFSITSQFYSYIIWGIIIFLFRFNLQWESELFTFADLNFFSWSCCSSH